MQKLKRLLVALGLASLFSVAFGAAASAEDLSREVGRFIVVDGNICTLGPLVSVGGQQYATTAAHCVHGDNSSVSFVTNPFVPIGSVRKIDYARDIAYIGVGGAHAGQWVEAPAPRPSTMACILTQVSRFCGPIVESGNVVRVWVQTCSFPGASGAPVVDDVGRFIGLLKGVLGGIPCVGPAAVNVLAPGTLVL